MANLLLIFFLAIFGCWFYPIRSAAVTYEMEATTEQLKQLLESRICETLPQLPSCLRNNGSMEDSLDAGGISPVAEFVSENAFLAMALDYIANTQQLNKELRERDTTKVMQVAKLELENEQLQLKVKSLEEEWPLSISRRQRAAVSTSGSGPVPYQPTANLLRPVDCADHLILGANVSGVYEIYPFKCRCSEPIKVWCDMETDGGGWTVFLMRQKPQNQSHALNFTRSWSEYRQGFGNASTEYWIGNENLNVMTNTRPYILRLDFQQKEGNFRWGEWTKFIVGDEANKYKLEVPTFNSRSMISNCLAHHNNRFFSTFDMDNDGIASKSCAIQHKSGWWFNNCATLDPLTPFTPEGHIGIMCTYLLNGKQVPLEGQFLQMKMRPAICSQLIKTVLFNTHTCVGHNAL